MAFTTGASAPASAIAAAGFARGLRPWQQLVLAGLCIILPIDGPPIALADHVPTFMPVTPVSPGFRSRAKSASTTIPRGIWEYLERAGWRVRLARFVVDADPSLTGRRPRGWPRNWSWENTDGVNLPSQRMVVLSEKRRMRSGKIVANSRVDGVLRHEVGHALDMILGGAFSMYSARPEFIREYRHDITRIPEHERHALSYYLHSATAGRQEAFAEAFSILLGGGTDQPNRGRFPHCFPRTMQLVQQTIDRFRPSERALKLRQHGFSPQNAPSATLARSASEGH